MNWYRHSFNIKGGLFLLGIALISALLIYSQKIVNELREDNRAIVSIYAEIMASTVRSESNENLNFIFEKIIRNVTFPVIQADKNGLPVSWRNLPDNISDEKSVMTYMKSLDRQNNPIPLIVQLPGDTTSIVLGSLHYGDSRMINQLNWLPYLEIIAVALFIIFGFIGFSLIRNSEKRSIWVGMARETAHQLGTPVSALMGWIDYIEDQPEKIKDVSPEMRVDLKRLEQVNSRFSEMGSFQKKEEISLIEVITKTINYLNKRIPGKGQKLSYDPNNNVDMKMQGNSVLLSWAFENLLKNSLDATSDQDGWVKLESVEKVNHVEIKIIDNGHGILRKDRKNIFRPGFSTKKHGWGLGLSLTKRIIEEIHAGDLSILESSPEQGTTFLIKFKKN